MIEEAAVAAVVVEAVAVEAAVAVIAAVAVAVAAVEAAAVDMAAAAEAAAAVAINLAAPEKCTKQPAQTVARKLKYHSYHPEIGLYIAEIVSRSTSHKDINLI